MKLFHILIYLQILDYALCFTFASLTVNADSKVINTVTTYQIDFDRTQDDALQPTTYLTTLITPTDKVTVTFPSTFVLSTVSCIISVNSGNQFAPPSCSVLGNAVVIANFVTSSTVVARVSVWISNILNPSPAIITDYFTGGIGSDVSGSGYFASNVILQPGIFTSCYSTFNPTTVNSTSNMIITLQPKNQIQSTGYIVIQFPATRRWANDISTTNYMPIVSSMSCSNRSSNVVSSIQCSGDINQVSVTATTLFAASVSTTFSFSINNFLSPPTNQQSDILVATSYSSTGYQIDTCNFYVSDLTPKTINVVSITTSSGGLMTVNLFYTIRLTFTLTDTLAQTDTLTVVFPTGSVVNFNNLTVTTNFSNAVSSATFQSSSSTLYVSLTNQNRIFGIGTILILTVGSYQAPPSIQATQNFILSIYRNNFKKLQGVAQVTALTSTVSGTVLSISSTTVNANTTYTFQIVTIDPISSTGKIKIVIPSSITILTSSASCATLTGTGTTSTPTCSFNTSENSITLSALNSSSAVIGAQTLTISISGLKNPPSISPTTSFSISTYYKSTDTSLVATGTITGITATSALLSNTQVSVTASTLIVNDISTTYSLQYKVSQPIPMGGYFTILIPSDITIDLTSLSSSCSINLNSTSYISTPCTGSAVTGGALINFTNPLAVDATLNTIILVRISSIFTNPSSTRPTSSFKLHTYHSNGYQIAYIGNAITIQMTTPANFNSISISRVSNKNYDLTTYTFTINQKSIFESASIMLITFPSNVVPSGSTLCALTTPTSTSLTCSYSASILRIVLSSSVIGSGVAVTITSTNIQNPPSFEPTGVFKFQSKTANQLYTYSLQTYSPGLTNTIPTQFPAISSQFTPAVYGEPVSLQINFTLTNSRIPTKIRLTLANSFIIGNLSCNSFIDFTGSCSIISTNTIQVAGTFSSAPLAFSITGITSPTSAPSDYSSMVTFDSGGYKIDQSTSAIKFTISCTMPCRTCQSLSQPTICTSCYSQTTISNMIYFDSTLKNCVSTCTSGKFADVTTNTCAPCDTNCLTCITSAIYCLSCNLTSSYKYLFVNTSVTPNTQVCLSGCPNQMYPDSSNSYICTPCVSPCVTCTSSTSCTSCISGRYLLGTSCGTTCPTGLYIPNPSTNKCDPCDTSCATCQIIITNCTSCNSPLLIYQNQCWTTCPTPLVPQNGTCGPCDSTCLTCVNDPYTCTGCDTGSTLPYLLNSRCLSTCPETYYNNVGLGICSLCSSVSGLNCNNCSSVSTCNTCNAGYVLLNSTCLNYVPSGYVNISGVAQPCAGDCGNCSISTTNCTSCKNYNLLNNICYQQCPSGYVGISKICQPCTSPCGTCATTTTICTSCLSTLNPKVYLSNSICIQTCPDSTYASNANYSCVNCVSPCQYCSSAALCLTCLNGYFLYNSNCNTSCPTGYTGVDRICKACLGNCATCQNETTLCTSCKPNTYLFLLNNSCVSSCGNGLFVDAVTQTCVYCTAPCKTCSSTSTTCLSCLTGVLYNYQCPTNCPNQYFNQSGVCQQCPNSCSFCTSLTSCNTCVNSYLQYNGYCVSQCPATNAVIINQACTACSGANCHQCTSADVCTMCNNQYSLLNGACLTSCPSGYKTNGTHCNDLTVQTLTSSSTSFPVPFTIAAAVLIIACLMSKLQFSKTFLPGAIFAFIGLLETGALAFFIYLYFTNFFVAQPLPFYVSLAAIAYLIVLNIFAFIIQNVIFCFDKQFKLWYFHSPNKCSTFWVNFLSLVLNHKFRNILFCKLFTFAVFTSQLQSVNKFKVINVFSFLSLIHSGAAIFAASVAIGYTQASSQLYYQCIDVIIVTALNAILAFFNVMKPYDFFYEMTPEGFQLKRKINAEQVFCQSNSKILPAGRQIQSQEGYNSNIFHGQGSMSKQGLNTALMTTKAYKEGTFKPYDISELSDESFGSLVHPKKLLQDASMQALERIDDPSFAQQEKFEEKVVEVQEQPKQESNHRNFDLTAIPPPGHQNFTDNSNYTTLFKYSDKGVGNTKDQMSQIGIQNTIDHGPQLQDRSIQPSYTKKVDQSAQRYSTFDPVDRSVQKTVFFRQDQSMQYAQSMKSKPPSVHDKSVSNIKASVQDQSVSNMKVSVHDQSVSNNKISVHDQSVSNRKVSVHDQSVNMKASMKDKSIQQIKSISNKSLMFQPSIRDQQAQKSTIQRIDEQIQMVPENDEKQIQAVQNISQKGNQKDMSVKQKSIQFAQSNKDKSVQHENIVQFDQFTEQMSPSKQNQHVVFEQEYFEENSPRNQQLKQQKKDEFLLPKQQIRSYQEELQHRIREKQQQLNKIKRKIQIQERKNQEKPQKKPKYYDQSNKIVENQQKSSLGNPPVSIQEQKTQLNQHQQALKKEPKHVEQELDAQIDKTIQQIQVIDDEGNQKKIKVQFQDQQNSKKSQQQFLGMLQEHPNQVIYQNSSEMNEQQTQNKFKQQNRNQLVQQQSQNSQKIKNLVLDQSQASKSKSNVTNIFDQRNKRGIQFLQSQAQISEGKDSSTKIYSSIRPINTNRKKSSKNRNFDNPDSSEEPSYDPINIKPIDPYQHHSYSDMSQTIEQMHANVNQTYESSHLNNEQIKNKLRQSIKQSMPIMSRLKKQIPSDRHQQFVHRRKFQPSSSNAVISNKNQKIQVKMDQQRKRRSSLLLVGRSQFTEEGLARKKFGNASPLKTAKRWEYQNQDKNIQQSGGEEQIKNTRLAHTHFINPMETDKSVLQFKTSRVGREEFRRQNIDYKPAPKMVERNLITDQISPFIGEINNQSPNKPRFDRRDFSQQFASEQISVQPYIQQDSDYASRYKNQIIIGQMLNRPGNKQLQQYYSKEKRKSRQKSKKGQQSDFMSETEKIYSQKIDPNRKR